MAAELERDAQTGVRGALERAIRQAVTARNIQLRDAPMVSNDGSDSIYSTVPTRSGAPAILPAMFSPGYAPSDLDFKLLKAAAGLAAVVLQFEDQ